MTGRGETAWELDDPSKRIIRQSNRTLVEIGDADPRFMDRRFLGTLTEIDGKGLRPRVVHRAWRVLRKGCLAIPRWYPKSLLDKHFPAHRTLDEAPSGPPPDPPGPIPLLAKPRDGTQREVVDYLAGEGAWRRLADEPQRVLAMQTGRGKTWAALAHMCRTGQRTIVFLHKKSLIANPWIKDAREFAGLGEDDVAVLSGRESVARWVDGGEDPKTRRLFLCVIRTPSNMLRTPEDTALLRRFFKRASFGLKIYDETHLEYRAIQMLDFEFNAWRTLYLSATPARTDRSAQRLYAMTLPPKSKWFGLETRNRDARYHNVVFELVSPGEECPEKNGPADLAFYNRWIAERFDLYWPAVRKWTDLISRTGAKAAVVCGTLDLVDEMVRRLSARHGAERVGEFTGRITDPEEKAVMLRRDFVVATLKALDAGDDSALGAVVNLQPMSSRVAIPQLVGRIRKRDNSPHLFVEIMDREFGWIARQHATKMPWIKTEIARRVRVVGV